MSLSDYRKLIDLEPGAYIAVRVEDPNARRPITLEANLEGRGIVLVLDESEAGELFDTLAAALRTVIGGRAVAKLHDTPRRAGSGPVSDASGKV